jgi:isoleucyl-tRNA synthetase
MLDRYILAKAKAAVLKVQASMDAYDTPGATEAITQFFDVLNNWYIRRSRPRFWGEEMTADKQSAYDTLFTVLNLMCIVSAPLLPFVSEVIYRGLNGAQTLPQRSSPPEGERALPLQSRGGMDVPSFTPHQNAKARFDSPSGGELKEVSVHLQDFPDVSGIDDAAELVADMDRVRDICNAALALRNKNNIRVRQPLNKIEIVVNDMNIADRWHKLYGREIAKIIEDEINVKEVGEGNMYLDDYASLVLQINSAALGKRLPAKMKQILPASKKGEWKHFGDGTVEIAGEKLLPSEYTLQLVPKEEYKDKASPLPTNDAVVILDLKVTPELEAEGRARDLVRMIQQARKDAGLNVGDRITLAVDVPADFKAAIAAHGDYIKEQTLAVSIGEGSASASSKITQELDGEQFVIGLSKVA